MTVQTRANTILSERLAHEYAYHPPPRPEVAERHEQVRATCREAAEKLVTLMPACPERQKALDALREAMFWGNAAIACYPDGMPAVQAAGTPAHPLHTHARPGSTGRLDVPPPTILCSICGQRPHTIRDVDRQRWLCVECAGEERTRGD